MTSKNAVSISAQKVLVLWADPDAENYGLRALAEGVRVMLRSSGASEVVFHSHNTPNTPLTKKKVLADLPRRRGPIVDYFSHFDLIVDTGGGDSFTDIYGVRRLVLQRYMYEAARRAKVPIVMSPQTIGPFDTVAGKKLARSVLKNADLVCSRDPVSTECAARFGRRVDHETTDLVFAVPVYTRPKMCDVVLNCSGLLWNENPHVESDYYRELIHELIVLLVEAGRSVTLLPHVIGSQGVDNDVPVAMELHDFYKERGVRVAVPADLWEMREILASSNVLVGSRMHACLNAISVGTPAIALAYSRKFAPLLDALDYPYHLDLRARGGLAADGVVDMMGPKKIDVMKTACVSLNERARASFSGLEDVFAVGPTDGSIGAEY